MIQLKTNKTGLYILIAEHTLLPKIAETHFREVADSNVYYLVWKTERNNNFRARFSIVGEIPELLVEKQVSEGNYIGKLCVRWKDVTNLVDCGMIRGVRSRRQLNTKIPGEEVISTS